MKTFEGKTYAEALKKASEELNMSVDILKGKARIISEKKGLFSTTVLIGIFSNKDVYEYAIGYLGKMLDFIGVSGSYVKKWDKATSMITIEITSDDASKVIGKNGETLKALNTLVRSACFNHFGDKYRILLNCGEYKEHKYAKLIALSKKLAKDVMESGVPASLDPMSADERRVVHNALLEFPEIESPSIGTGKERHIIIQKRKQ